MSSWIDCNTKRSIEYYRSRPKTSAKRYRHYHWLKSVTLELLTNATVVDDAIRFVSQQSKMTIKSSSQDNQEESKEPDYDEDQDQLEEEQEEEIGEKAAVATTINEVF